MENKKILVVGVTGLQGSGKSFCAGLFQELGALLFNCDISAQIVQTKNQELRDKIVEKFGAVYYTGKMVNKQFAKDLFFSGTDDSVKNLKWITDTIIPYIRQAFQDYKKMMEDNGIDGYILIESAILFETGMNNMCDMTICVKSPNPIAATYGRDYTTKEEWIIRMASQLPDSEKTFDIIIGNDYTKAVMIQVQQVHQKIIEKMKSSRK